MPILSALTPISFIEKTVVLPILESMDHDVSEYEKGLPKDYFHRVENDISSYVSHCVLASVEDVGYDPHGNGTLRNAFDREKNGKITFRQGASNFRLKQLVIEGTVHVSSIDFPPP